MKRLFALIICCALIKAELRTDSYSVCQDLAPGYSRDFRLLAIRTKEFEPLFYELDVRSGYTHEEAKKRAKQSVDVMYEDRPIVYDYAKRPYFLIFSFVVDKFISGCYVGFLFESFGVTKVGKFDLEGLRNYEKMMQEIENFYLKCSCGDRFISFPNFLCFDIISIYDLSEDVIICDPKKVLTSIDGKKFLIVYEGSLMEFFLRDSCSSRIKHHINFWINKILYKIYNLSFFKNKPK